MYIHLWVWILAKNFMFVYTHIVYVCVIFVIFQSSEGNKGTPKDIF